MRYPIISGRLCANRRRPWCQGGFILHIFPISPVASPQNILCQEFVVRFIDTLKVTLVVAIGGLDIATCVRLGGHVRTPEYFGQTSIRALGLYRYNRVRIFCMIAQHYAPHERVFRQKTREHATSSESLLLSMEIIHQTIQHTR